MKRLLLLFLALLLVVPVVPAQPKAKQSLFINLTSDNIDRASMAITLGHRVLKEKKVPVTIWLNVDAVRLVNKNVRQNMYSDARTPLEKLQSFMKEGGKVMICPMCMRNLGGLELKDLPEGVVVSEMDMWWDAMYAEGARVLSY
jgi:predicted peroxiredoxin